MEFIKKSLSYRLNINGIKTFILNAISIPIIGNMHDMACVSVKSRVIPSLAIRMYAIWLTSKTSVESVESMP